MYRFNRENWARKVNGVYPKTWTSTGSDYGFFLDRKKHMVRSQYAATHPESDYPALYTRSRPISAVRRSVGDPPHIHLTRRKRIRAGEDYYVQHRRRNASWNAAHSRRAVVDHPRNDKYFTVGATFRPRSASLPNTNLVRQVNTSINRSTIQPRESNSEPMTSKYYPRSLSPSSRIVVTPPPALLSHYEVNRSVSPTPLTLAHLKRYNSPPIFQEPHPRRSLTPLTLAHLKRYNLPRSFQASHLRPSLAPLTLDHLKRYNVSPLRTSSPCSEPLRERLYHSRSPSYDRESHVQRGSYYDVIYPRRQHFTRNLSPLTHRQPSLIFEEQIANDRKFSPLSFRIPNRSPRPSSFRHPRPPTPHSKVDQPGHIPRSTYLKQMRVVNPTISQGEYTSRINYGYNRLPLSDRGYYDVTSSYPLKQDVYSERHPYRRYEEKPERDSYTERIKNNYQNKAEVKSSPERSYFQSHAEHRAPVTHNNGYHSRSNNATSNNMVSPARYVEYRRFNEVNHRDVEESTRPGPTLIPFRRRVKEAGINQRFFDVRNQHHHDTWNSYGRNNNY